MELQWLSLAVPLGVIFIASVANLIRALRRVQFLLTEETL